MDRSSSGSFSFAQLFEAESGVGSTEHWGHIRCRCGHHRDETLAQARRGSRIHLNGTCLWSCCGANWDDFTCTKPMTPLGKKSKKDYADVDDDDGSEETRRAVWEREQRRLRRYLPTFQTQELVCLACFRPYRDPVRLACGHTLCRECLHKRAEYQRAAASFSSHLRGLLAGTAASTSSAAPAESAAAVAAADDHKLGNMRMRQLTRTQRRALEAARTGGDKPAEEKDKDKKEEAEDVPPEAREMVVCPVCTACTRVAAATADTEMCARLAERAEQERRGVCAKCAFCMSAVLAGVQAEAEDAGLVCATCGPVCARHHALVHVAGPPTFRGHDVRAAPLALVPVLDRVPAHYEVCARHGCVMDLFDTVLEQPLCEMCATAFARRSNMARIIRAEDKLAFMLKKEAEAEARAAAAAATRRSEAEAARDQAAQERAKFAELRESLAARTERCSGVLARSRDLCAAGQLTREAGGLAEFRGRVRELFAESRAALDEMERSLEADVERVLACADARLQQRYEAAATLLAEAQATLQRTAALPLDASAATRVIAMKRLRDVLESLDRIERLPTEPAALDTIFTAQTNPEAVKKCRLVALCPCADLREATRGKLLLPLGDADACEDAKKDDDDDDSHGSDKDEDSDDDEDEDAVLARIRKELADEDRRHGNQQARRDNGRYSSLRSAVSSDMGDSMQRETIGMVIYERSGDVLGTDDFEVAAAVTGMLFEKNTLEHILRNLSTPADFNRELRAIHQFLIQTGRL